MADDTDDLNAAIEAAFAGDAAGAEGGVAPAGGDDAPRPSQPSRDASGRFAKDEGGSGDAALDAGLDVALGGGNVPPPPDDAPPDGWAPEVWAQLAPDVRTRVAEQAKAVRERDERLKGYEPLDRVLASRRDQLTARFGAPERGVETLLHLAEWADRDPVGFLVDQARQRGIPGDTLMRALGGGVGVQAATLTPEQQVQAYIAREVQDRLTAREVEQEYAAFSQEPGLEYRDHAGVKALMASLLENRAATGYRQAYDMATQAHPEIGPKLRAAEAERAAKGDAARRAEGARAKMNAAVGVSGAPGTTRVPAARGPDPSNLDALLRDAFEQADRGRI